ncbi:MAG: type II secretion system protein [Gemmatimonadota bacterium]
MRARAFRRRHAAGGMTLVEILIALAVAGILAAGGVVALGRLGRNQAYQGYVSGFGQAVSDATTRANQTNTIYALTFDGSGYSWGPVGGTLSSCTGAASAPTLTSGPGKSEKIFISVGGQVIVQ